MCQHSWLHCPLARSAGNSGCKAPNRKHFIASLSQGPGALTRCTRDEALTEGMLRAVSVRLLNLRVSIKLL